MLEDERVARAFPPLPPEALRATVCGGATLASHLYTGAEDFRMLGELFEVFAERPLAGVASVLDFGCGCGRALRWFERALPDARIVGTDVRAAAIDWCRASLRGDYVANDVLPPLPLPDASIELTFALSVFSHLSREQAFAWLRELARVTRPDGLLLITTHGAFAAAVCARSPEHQQLLQMSPDEAHAVLRRLAPERFVHRVLPAAIRRSADGVADDYGQAFFTEEFVRRDWGDLVELVGCVPCGLNLFQDVFALRPRR